MTWSYKRLCPEEVTLDVGVALAQVASAAAS
jgi:hypothetical protein